VFFCWWPSRIANTGTVANQHLAAGVPERVSSAAQHVAQTVHHGVNRQRHNECGPGRKPDSASGFGQWHNVEADSTRSTMTICDFAALALLCASPLLYGLLAGRLLIRVMLALYPE
jgi:hypothetical protein